MTSRELTFGFDFWSRGHLRMAVMHLPITYSADIFIWSDRVIDNFPKSKMAADVLTVWYLCCVPNLVQIYVIITESDALTILTFI